MREYTNTITFTKNVRGVYSLDPILGCASGMAENEKDATEIVTQHDILRSTVMIFLKMC